jgi:hypothetical protein
MDQVFTDPAQARIIFSAADSMCGGYAGAGQSGSK